MKLAKFKVNQAVKLGVVDVDNAVIKVIQSPGNTIDPMIAVIEGLSNGTSPEYTGETFAINDVHLLSPISQPNKNIICVGKNYHAHAKEFAGSGFDSNKTDVIPDLPIIFTKAPSSLNGPYDDVVVPWTLSEKIDYESELGVIIGKGGRTISKENAYDHVFGYTVINDVTARDTQSAHKQWFLGKSIDTFCPMGPWIVSADEVDPTNMEITGIINGEERQRANTSDLIFDIPTIIAAISASMTLSPGDIIATGTPAGVGIGFNPPKFLKKGDVMKIAISGIGYIENTIT
ncbi:fumarylacetoacetate hydrolase family protein [Mucilaginibacter sp.]|uniref:fumarylacetoacetate hydrolase family protein n=1 Tax=Mucilaginibacter sp. TaxID=1882438 RepID=UPI0026357443|nr:fumarylacetoacetate hydrolase family protein [Mucilaginibacter sp.]MDB4926521.1 hydrolase [Mucilaginibacter sp.]